MCDRRLLVWFFFLPFSLSKIKPEKAMATHSSTLAWKIPWTEGPGRLQSMGSLGVGHNWETFLSLSCIGEGNGNSLQCSCLENPRDREPGGLPSMGSHRVGYDWSDLAAAAAARLSLMWEMATSNSNSSTKQKKEVKEEGKQEGKKEQGKQAPFYPVMKEDWLERSKNPWTWVHMAFPS